MYIARGPLAVSAYPHQSSPNMSKLSSSTTTCYAANDRPCHLPDSTGTSRVRCCELPPTCAVAFSSMIAIAFSRCHPNCTHRPAPPPPLEIDSGRRRPPGVCTAGRLEERPLRARPASAAAAPEVALGLGRSAPQPPRVGRPPPRSAVACGRRATAVSGGGRGPAGGRE